MADKTVEAKKIGIVCVFLILLVLAVFFQVTRFEFLNFDDDLYVSGNPHIRSGMTREGIRWAFSADLLFDSPHADYWQPVTFLSRLIDTQFFGMSPSGHHAMNLFYHMLNVLALFWLLSRMTGNFWASACVAALFAVHPLRVEPVAWVTARKDLMGTFWGFAGIAAYGFFLKKKSMERMFLVAFAFLMSLMSKAFWITFPFCLLLLDFWPLARTDKNRLPGIGLWGKYLLEKWPLFLAGAAFFFIPFIGQPKALRYTAPETILLKAGIACFDYLGKFFWPSGLGIYGPAPERILGLWQYAAAGLLLGSLTVIAFLQAKKRPYFLFGWLWYLVTVIPSACMALQADRFMMVPSIGLLVLVVWGASESLRKIPFGKIAGAVLACAAILVFSWLSWRQLQYWRDNEALFRRMIAVNPRNYVAHNNLGSLMAERGNLEEALRQCEESLKINPAYANAYNNLGAIRVKQGKTEEALGYYEQALKLKPDLSRAYYNIAEVLFKTGKPGEAIPYYSEAIRQDPYYAAAYYGLGEIFARQGNLFEALMQFTKAVELNPYFPEAENSLGAMLAASGRHQEAVFHYERAVHLDPRYSQAYNNLGISLALFGRNVDALNCFREAIRIRPDFAEAHCNLGVALMRMNQWDEASGHFETALRINPGYAKAAAFLEQVRDMRFGGQEK